MTSAAFEYVLASRPYSFTASIVPILMTAVVLGSPLRSELFIRAMIMGVAVQAGANLTNTYFDFFKGVDTKCMEGGDKALVEAKKITSTGVFLLSIICYAVGLFAVYPTLVSSEVNRSIVYIFVSGISLAFFYTANPVGLKYMALGDVTIYICFGPLLMQGVSIMLSGRIEPSLYLYSVPVGLLTEAILHANNARDIKNDTKAGAVTLASLLGFQWSFYFYSSLLVGSYIATFLISFYYHWGCLAAFATALLAAPLIKSFNKRMMKDLVEDTAKFHLLFGLLLVLGIMYTKEGLLRFVS